ARLPRALLGRTGDRVAAARRAGGAAAQVATRIPPRRHVVRRVPAPEGDLRARLARRRELLPFADARLSRLRPARREHPAARARCARATGTVVAPPPAAQADL